MEKFPVHLCSYKKKEQDIAYCIVVIPFAGIFHGDDGVGDRSGCRRKYHRTRQKQKPGPGCIDGSFPEYVMGDIPQDNAKPDG